MIFLLPKRSIIMDIDHYKPDQKWKVMNDLEQAFNQISTFDFLLDQLQEAVDSNNRQQIVDITLALNAFIVPFSNNWDKKFKEAWKEVITKDHQSIPGSVPMDLSQWEEYWEKEAQKSKDQKQE